MIESIQEKTKNPFQPSQKNAHARLVKSRGLVISFP